MTLMTSCVVCTAATHFCLWLLLYSSWLGRDGGRDFLLTSPAYALVWSFSMCWIRSLEMQSWVRDTTK